jgi:hypothetical protein
MSVQIVRVRVHRDVDGGAEAADIFEDTSPDSERGCAFDSVVLDMMCAPSGLAVFGGPLS